MNRTWLITSELANHRARKVLFTCAWYILTKHITQVSVLCNEPKFWQLTIVFSAFYKLFLETTSFSTTPIGQIIPCHNVTIFLVDYITTLLVSPSFRNSSKYLAKKCREVSRYKKRHSYKKDCGKHLISQK